MFNISEAIIQYLKKKNEEEKPVSSKGEEKVESNSDGQRRLLIEGLTDLNNQLSGKKNDIQLEKIEYAPLTDEEIEKAASGKVNSKYALKQSALEKENKQAIENLEKQNSELQNSVADKKETLEKAYKELEENLNANAIKRGISRSSIVSEQIKNLGVEKIRDQLKIDESVAAEIKENSDKISGLEQEYVSAVNTLNLEKAIELGDVIDGLKKEQEEKIEEVLKYNNTVKNQQASLDGKVSDLTEVEIANINSKIIKNTLDYYLSMPKAERLKAFEEDEEMKEILGDNASIVERYLRASA